MHEPYAPLVERSTMLDSTAPTLRDYQVRAVRRVREEWQEHRAVCLVGPCASGKTAVGSALAAPMPTVWVAHREELVKQATEALRAVGCQAHVATVQQLLASGDRPPAELLVLDECHHIARGAPEWYSLLEAYPDTRILGLTATPQRSDGSPLGDVYSSLVELAAYSELLEAGHIVPCHVYARPADAPSSGWATDPVTAYQRYTPNGRAIVFLDRVERCVEWLQKFAANGYRAAVVHGNMPKDEREKTLKQFQSGRLQVLLNVYVLTEGTDLPEADVCILGRGMRHATTYIQCVGRVLRLAPGKTHATLIDLVDATHSHGYPTEDRHYSLDGQAITVERATALSTCLQCGAVYNAGPTCPRCGFQRPVAPKPTIRIYDIELERVYAGAETPSDAKQREYQRLRNVQRSKGFSLGWVVAEYKKLFQLPPPLVDVTPEERGEELQRLVLMGRQKNFKSGWASHRYKAMFGRWPPRQW